MNCLFCGSGEVIKKTDKSYERHYGDNVFFEYSYLSCGNCFAEFIDDEISTNNAASYSKMMKELNKKQIKITHHTNDEISPFGITELIAMYSSVINKNKALACIQGVADTVDDYKNDVINFRPISSRNSIASAYSI